MTVISESDLDVVECQGCSGAAVYVVTVVGAETLRRLYCPGCTSTLFAGAAKVLADNKAHDQFLHEYLSCEYLFNGWVI